MWSKEVLVLSALAVLLLGFAAVALYQFWRRRAAPPRRLNYHGFAESKFVTIDGFKVHYVQEGKGPDLLLVHGIASSIFCWRLIFPALVKNYRVTALDLPGFGLSEKKVDDEYTLDAQTERLHQFLDHLNIKETFVLAHSMGGAISAWFTKLYPFRVKKVVFLAPALNHRIVWINAKRYLWLVKLTKRFLVTPFLVKLIYNRQVLGEPRAEEDVEHAVMQYYLPFHESPDTLVAFVKSTNLVRDERFPKGISPFPRPAKILYGLKDRVVRRKYLDEFLSLNQQVVIAYESNAGHQLMEENPSFVLQETQSFFEN